MLTSHSALQSRSLRPSRQALLREARDRLRTRVLASIDARGAIWGRCRGRVLESALLLCLLRRRGTHARIRESLVDFLHSADTAMLDPFSATLRQAALDVGVTTEASGPSEDHLPGFEHFTAGRKRVLFSVVLGVVRGRMPELGLTREDFAVDTRHQSWTVRMMQALEVLYLVGRGRHSEVEASSVSSLVAMTVSTPVGLWEQYVLGQLIALLAMAELPEMSLRVERGVESVIEHRDSDGGIPFITRMDVFVTATSGLALREMVDAPRALRPLGDFINRRQQSDGGWAFALGVTQTDVDDTSYCMQLLRSLDPDRYRTAIDRGERYLVDIQNDDGGFPTFAPEGCSEVTMTAAGVNALAPGGARWARAVERGRDYLMRFQRPDGTFERSWSGAHANAIVRVLRALRGTDGGRAERSLRVERRAMAYLTRAQNPDGGWGQQLTDASDPISTAYSLLALVDADRDVAREVERGVEYLLSEQRSHGGFDSPRPDSLGPRPLAYDVPALTDAFVLMALGRVCRRR